MRMGNVLVIERFCIQNSKNAFRKIIFRFIVLVYIVDVV